MEAPATRSANFTSRSNDVNGFAGSERAGERRRRRLAVESEGSEQAVATFWGSGDTLLRFFASPGREADQLTDSNCPILNIASAPVWKQCLTVLMGVIAGIGLILAGQTWPDWGPAYGPGLARLLKSTSSPVTIWFNTIVLFMTAQGAALILWARSRSPRDFHGNYRIWGWASATWLFFSFVTATQAHLAFSETILFHIRWKTPGAPMWCWLLPATAWGWGIALRLEPELRNDRSGHLLFLTAGAWYMAVAGILCQKEFWPQLCPAALATLLAACCQLLGHASLFLSTLLHARFVLLFSSDPPPSKRRTTAKTVEAVETPEPGRRMWPRWLSWSSSTEEAETEESEEDKPKRGRKRTAATVSKKKTSTRKSSRRGKAAAEEEEEAVTEETSGWDESAGEEWETAETAATDSAEDSSETNYRIDDAEEPAGDHYSDDSDSDESLRGLSKRERRRLQQEQREKARRRG